MKKILIGAFLLAIAATSANAASIPGTFSYESGTGSFNVGSLSGEMITGGTANFVFNALSGYSLSSSSYFSSGSLNSSYFTTYRTNNYADPLDVAKVSIGGLEVSASNINGYASTANVTSNSSTYSYQSGVGYQYYSCGLFRTCSSPYPIYSTGNRTDFVTNNYSGYTGPFTVSLNLAGNDWVGKNALTPFSVVTTNGYAQLASARLDYTSIAVAPAIPEPETYAMFLAGIGLIGTVARRRKQGTNT